LPGKNLRKLGGIPLIAHSIKYALANAEILDKIIVTTDSPEIKEIALLFGAEVIDRPADLSGDKSPTLDAVKHVLEKEESKWDNVILLQPTNPLRPSDLLSKAYKKFISQDYDSLFTVSSDKKKIGQIRNGIFHPSNYSFGECSQEIEPFYYENGLLYIAKIGLLETNLLISKKACPFIVDHPFSKVDIDTLQDFEFAEYQCKKYYEY